MPPKRETIVKSYTTGQCLQSCNNQRSQCLAMNISNPSPVNASKIQQCYNNNNSCVKACTTNNIRPFAK